jgi:hypothetical protein
MAGSKNARPGGWKNDKLTGKCEIQLIEQGG